MGLDKSQLDYHGAPQAEHAVRLLSEVCEVVYRSGPGFLEDASSGLGPVSGLIAAFRKHPEAAWLVLACDLPGASRDAIRFLVDRRDPNRDAVAFGTREEPEPLFSLWEPRLTSRQDFSDLSPSRALRASECLWLSAPDPDWIRNVNTPAELASWKAERNAASEARR